ncbi:MAG: Transcriptional regulator, LysR family protein [Myxococcaceae bacterium]|nr:Transcriptional regulator, LysR family protein [Myxococcaceae bacterium]
MADPMTELDLNDLAVFVRVVEQGGFAKAARELRVPTSTVSRTVARLEEAVGARLLQRTTRSVQQTEEGRALFESVAPALASLVHAARSIESPDTEPRGKLRITAPNDLGSTFIAEVAAGFVAKYPHVEVEFELTPRVVNLVQEGFDLAIRAGRLVDSALVARRVGDLAAQLFASPAYLARHGAPTEIAELASHVCVVFRPRDGSATWNLEHASTGETVDVVVHGRLGGDDFSFIRTAVLAGAGIGLVPRVLCHQDVAAGRLIRVLPDYAMRGGGSFHIVYPSSRHVPTRVTAFRDFIVAAFSSCGPHFNAEPAAPKAKAKSKTTASAKKTNGKGASRATAPRGPR